MKNNIKFVAIILFFSVFIMLISCKKQNAEWKGTIEYENGVTIVKNPKDSIHGKDVFSLDEELSIGKAEGEEKYLFSRINDIDVDNEGNIYVVDAVFAHIRVFNKNGEYLRTIGRKGQGPGEMQMPIYVQITSQDELMVHDYMAQRLSFFSLDGKYLRQKSTAKTRNFFIPIKTDTHGNFIVIANFGPPPVGGKEMKIYDSNLELLMVIAKEERGQRGVFDIEKPTWYCDVSPNDHIVWGDSKKYVLEILNQEGELMKKIIKEHEPIEIKIEDRERYRKLYAEPVKMGFKLNFRKHFPAFQDISVDEKERIFVKTYERVESEGDYFYFDVFDLEGKYIAKVPIQVNLNRNSVWRRNKLYTIEEDEEGYHVVKRYKVNWNI